MILEDTEGFFKALKSRFFQQKKIQIVILKTQQCNVVIS